MMKRKVVVNPYARKQQKVAQNTKSFDIFKGLKENDGSSCDKTDEEASKKTPQTNNEEAATSLSISLPVWHRLPSASLSFGSAEILTMPQACAIREPCGQSIRVTGIVVHRSVTDSSGVNLVLGDPVRRASSILKPSAKQKPKKTASVLFDKTKTKKLVFRKKTERRLSFASGCLAKVDPAVQLENALRLDNRLWVSAPPETVLQLQDAVTVIGEMELRDNRPCLIARIVRNTNGVHMKLYQDALLARQVRLAASSRKNGSEERSQPALE